MRVSGLNTAIFYNAYYHDYGPKGSRNVSAMRPKKPARDSRIITRGSLHLRHRTYLIILSCYCKLSIRKNTGGKRRLKNSESCSAGNLIILDVSTWLPRRFTIEFANRSLGKGLIKNSGMIPASSRTTGVLLIQRSVSRASWERGNGLENFHPLICIRSASACHCTHIFTDRLVTLYDYTSNGSISDQNRLFRPLRAAPLKMERN
ncbi:hypothetical protein TcasGA2_TC008634 [Tribolium castaneum]|uniref:Uncharacterized protein n=1 Tax=Tribolium castaneum TaxID=7070 RepID=D6WTI4_TRICA|nr:hypothetical protein TcasGA2_TC008634 [Tribolium castaneum]